MEITPLGSISLEIWVVGLLGSSHGISHAFRDGYYLHGLNVEVVLWDTGVIK